MPIRFRCSYCNRLLGIATRKAGMETICPHCGYTITVPVPQEDNGRPDDDARTERLDLEDIEELLGNAVTEVAAPPAVVAAPVAEKPRPPVPTYPKPTVSPPAPKVRVDSERPGLKAKNLLLRHHSVRNEVWRWQM